RFCHVGRVPVGNGLPKSRPVSGVIAFSEQNLTIGRASSWDGITAGKPGAERVDQRESTRPASTGAAPPDTGRPGATTAAGQRPGSGTTGLPAFGKHRKRLR